MVDGNLAYCMLFRQHLLCYTFYRIGGEMLDRISTMEWEESNGQDQEIVNNSPRGGA